MNHDFLYFPTGCFTGVQFEAGVGCEFFAADGAAPLLFAPYREQFVSAFEVMEHFLAFSFLVIFRPRLVKGIRFRFDFRKSNYFRVGSIFEA